MCADGPVRLTFLIDSMQARAGTERVTASVAGGLARRGHDVQILTLRGQESAFELPSAVTLRSLGRPAGLIRVRGETPGLIWDIRRELRARRPAVLVVVDTFLCAFAYPAALGLGVRRVGWEHFNFQNNMNMRSRDLARHVAAHFGHELVTLTERDADHWRQAMPGARARLSAISNPLSFPLLAHNPYDPERRTLLAVGRLDGHKGFDLLLRAWASVEADLPEWSLRIVGSGVEEASLRALAASLGLRRWSLEGSTPDIVGAFQQAGAFCLSSRQEGLPMVLMEAQAYGLPAVAFDCPIGPAELLATGGGLLVPPENVSELGQALRRTLSDAALRGQLSARAFEGAQRYAADHILDQWEGLLCGLSGAPGRTAWSADIDGDAMTPKQDSPTRVSLIDPFIGGHHTPYAAWVAGGLLHRGQAVQLVGLGRWVHETRERIRSLGDGEVEICEIDIHPEGLEAFFGLPTPQREQHAVRFMRAAGQAAQAFGSDVAHLLWLDRFVLPLLAAWPAYRGLNVQATLHNITMLPPFQAESRSRRWRGVAEAWAIRQLQQRGLHLQMHSRRVSGQLGGAAGRSSFVPHPAQALPQGAADPAGAQALRSALGLRAGDRLLLAFGGTRHDKGADLAARLLPQLPEHVHLLVAGQAEQLRAQDLRELAGPAQHRLHLQLDFVPDEQVNSLFLAADALLLPYRPSFAGQSGPLNIAGALGIPVAAADVGLLAECIREYSLGTVFRSEDLPDMARAVGQVLTRPRGAPSTAFLRDHSLASFQAAVQGAYRGNARRTGIPGPRRSGQTGP